MIIQVHCKKVAMFSKDATLHSVNEVQYTMNLKLKRAAYRPNFYQCNLKVNVKSGITGTCL